MHDRRHFGDWHEYDLKVSICSLGTSCTPTKYGEQGDRGRDRRGNRYAAANTQTTFGTWSDERAHPGGGARICMRDLPSQTRVEALHRPRQAVANRFDPHGCSQRLAEWGGLGFLDRAFVDRGQELRTLEFRWGLGSLRQQTADRQRRAEAALAGSAGCRMRRLLAPTRCVDVVCERAGERHALTGWGGLVHAPSP